MTENKTPAFKTRAGGVQATVWKNTKEINGRKVDFYNTTINRSYKDKNEWKTTDTYSKDDLPKVALVTEKCYDFIIAQASNKENQEEE